MEKQKMNHLENRKAGAMKHQGKVIRCFCIWKRTEKVWIGTRRNIPAFSGR